MSHHSGSMFNQHSQVAQGLPSHVPWRRPMARATTCHSHVWLPDHNWLQVTRLPRFLGTTCQQEGRGVMRGIYRAPRRPTRPEALPIIASQPQLRPRWSSPAEQAAPQWAPMDRRVKHNHRGPRIW